MESQPTDAKGIEDTIRFILDYIGEDVAREGLRNTPARVIRSWAYLFKGYKEDPEKLMTVFTEGACDEMVILKGVEFYSTCEHHMLPFFGTISIGYIPRGRVIGVSKLARLVEVYARRLQTQEKMTSQIASIIMRQLKPLGVMVICQAKHLCMIARGVQKQNSVLVTSAVRGVFREKIEAREEFLRLAQ